MKISAFSRGEWGGKGVPANHFKFSLIATQYIRELASCQNCVHYEICCLPAENRNFRLMRDKTEIYVILQSRLVFHAPIVSTSISKYHL
jgi:hypothetical protein